MFPKLLAQLEPVLFRAGEKLRAHYGRELEITRKADGSPVTHADLASNGVLCEGLAQFGYPIVSEESFADRRESEYVWLIDPLDGTKGFIEKNGEFCIMVGLLRSNEPVFGTIFDPLNAALYYGWKDGGAHASIQGSAPRKIRVSGKKNPAEMTLLISRHHASAAEEKVAEKLHIYRTAKAGSAGLKAARIACGEAEITILNSPASGEWDTCAAQIILAEAGGRMTDLDGMPLTYNKLELRNPRGYVMSSGFAHQEIIEALKSVSW